MAVHTFGRRDASLGLIVLDGEVVERAGGRAHAWSGSFGLNLRRLFGHDRHLLVTGGLGGGFGGMLGLSSGSGSGGRRCSRSGSRNNTGFGVLVGGGERLVGSRLRSERNFTNEG